MRGLIIGSGGQLGQALQQTIPQGVELTAPPEAECNLTNAEDIEHWLAAVKPDVVFNAAAYTAVDAAEKDVAIATLVNAEAVGRLASAVQAAGAKLIHVSTDFVFDGRSGRPYSPEDTPNPLSVYGKTKLDGERAALQYAPHTLIVRTAWVYSEVGRNFVNTMLRLMRERSEISVVADQFGTPTYVRNLAEVLWSLAARNAEGIFHFTDAGAASWYDFAVAIAEESVTLGLIAKMPNIKPIRTEDYPTPAQRPGFSVLDKSKTTAVLGTHGQHWRDALRCMLRRLVHNG